jgi:outer membrane immunogenic protein
MKILKKQLLATTCTLVLGSGLGGAANAASPTPMYSWTGFYVGANVGIARLNATATATQGYGYYGECTGYGGMASCTDAATGIVAGPEAGFDWQDGNFVYGVVGDWSYTALKNTIKSTFSDSGNNGSITAQVNWLASLRGRMGMDLNATLVYFTGGLALGHVNSSTYAPGSSGNGGSYGALDTTQVGWVAGIGIEHKFNQQWSVKGEFLYYDLGSQVSPGTTRVGITYASEFTHEILVGQVGLAYHF